MSMMGDDMPYVISELDQKEQDIAKGSSFTCDTAIIANMSVKCWSIEYPDGYSITGNSDKIFTDQDITCFFPEGTKFTFSHSSSNGGTLFYFPLRKLGGGHKYPVVFFRSYQLNNMVCINRIKFKKRA